MGKTFVRDMVVFLPGITGSVLWDESGREVWGASAKALWAAVRSRGGSLQQLRLADDDDPQRPTAPDGVTASGIVRGPHPVPGLSSLAAYTPVLRALDDNFHLFSRRQGYDGPVNFIEFGYDWRRDNRASAFALKRLVDRELEKWRATPAGEGAKLILVGHSMGGLVARYFVDVLDGWRDTRMVITYGTPHRGSLDALSYLHEGFRKFGILDLTDVLRSCASVYQLLPVYPCVESSDELLRVTDAPIPHIDPDMAAAALDFHREIRDNNARRGDLGQPLVVPVVGTHQPTRQRAVRSGETIAVTQDHPSWLEAGLGGGDGTVPLVSAIPVELSESGGHFYVAERHGTLHSHVGVMSDLVSRIKLSQSRGLKAVAGDVTAQRGQARLSVDLAEAVLAGEPVRITARVVEEDGTDLTVGAGVLRATFDDALGEGSLGVAMTPDDSGQYGADVMLPPGMYELTVHPESRGPTDPSPLHAAVTVIE